MSLSSILKRYKKEFGLCDTSKPTGNCDCARELKFLTSAIKEALREQKHYIYDKIMEHLYDERSSDTISALFNDADKHLETFLNS